MTDERAEHKPWPLRALLLFGLGALLGLVFDLLIRDRAESYFSTTEDVLRLSLATFVATSGLLFAFTLERERWTWSVAFAAVGGALLALVFYWNGAPGQQSADDFWQFVSGLLAVAIAAPLFQTMRDLGRRELPYTIVLAHAWTNVVLWFAAWAFVLISFLLAQLLAELFRLIGIELLRDLFNKSWAIMMLVCGALGAAVGLLRDRDRVLGLLQRVVTTVLSVLAPVLAIGLVLFVLALPFTGLAPLWDQTRATTPILLSCVIGAIILANAVIGNSADEEAKAPPLRWSAMALSAVALPLVVVAAISTSLRIGQHGFTPARLWALVFILIAGAFAAAYLLALIRGRAGWAPLIRRTNIALALGVCAVALLLASPLISFGALSTRDQLARLQSGRIAPERFDWAALRYDFGPSGRLALERLRAQSGNADIRRFASAALETDNRWELVQRQDREERATEMRLQVIPAGAVLPEALRREIAEDTVCQGEAGCALLYRRGDRAAILVEANPCAPRDRGPRSGLGCAPAVTRYVAEGSEWREVETEPSPRDEALARRLVDAVRAGQVEIRTVPRRQVFIAGRPVGDAFE
jgi:hypothetical protein